MSRNKEKMKMGLDEKTLINFSSIGHKKGFFVDGTVFFVRRSPMWNDQNKWEFRSYDGFNYKLYTLKEKGQEGRDCYIVRSVNSDTYDSEDLPIREVVTGMNLEEVIQYCKKLTEKKKERIFKDLIGSPLHITAEIKELDKLDFESDEILRKIENGN